MADAQSGALMSDATERTDRRATTYRLFVAALELAVETRGPFLDEHCGSDGALRAEVAALLAIADADAGRDGANTRALAATAPRLEQSLTGKVFGRFRLLQPLGEGGMGVVYLAERTDGVQQLVAIKLVSSILARAARPRFIREAQILARLEHSSVARFIDAGIEDGRAWIAIEYVRGERIDSYCENRQLSVTAIVRLLIPLAGAVSAAHALLVVHSDIKPANVLVTADGFPKLIDFGISTALREAETERAPTINIGRLFSPNYAAAEQIDGGPVTVATDVFGLGALAYRLLTGVPIHRDAMGPLDYLVALTKKDVELPSRAALAAGRTEPHARLLRGDLDAILSKALERDPARRYASAADFQADLQRYLDARPVLARAPSKRYRVAKFVRRHATAVGLSSMLIASLLGGGLFAGIQGRRAALARDESRAVTAFLANDILAAANPMVAGTRDVQLRPLLDQASLKLSQRFADQPTVLAELQAAMGTGYAALFATDKAEALLRAAELGLARERGDSDQETENARLALWYLYVGNVDLAKVFALSKRIAAAEHAAGRPDSAMAFRARLALEWIPCMLRAPGISLSDCGAVVRPIYADALEHFGPDALATQELGYFLGVALIMSAREDEAEPVLRKACAGMQRYYGAVHHRLNACRRYLAKALDENGKSEEAVPLFEQAVRNFGVTLGPDNRFTVISKFELASSLFHSGRFADAIQVTKAVRVMPPPTELEPSALWRAQALMAVALVKSGQTLEGLALAERVLAAAIQADGARSVSLLSLRERIATALLEAGTPARAEVLLRENVALGTQLVNRPAWLDSQLQASLARALIAEHRNAEALPLLQAAVKVLEHELGHGNPRTVAATAALAQLR